VSDSDAVSYRSPEFPASQHERAQFVETRDKRLSHYWSENGQSWRGESDRGRCLLGRDENEERWRGLVKYRRETRATEREENEIERTNGKGARRKKKAMKHRDGREQQRRMRRGE